jgi:hypothetical protein
MAVVVEAVAKMAEAATSTLIDGSRPAGDDQSSRPACNGDQQQKKQQNAAQQQLLALPWCGCIQLGQPFVFPGLHVAGDVVGVVVGRLKHLACPGWIPPAVRRAAAIMLISKQSAKLQNSSKFILE